jgi:hypothetical protein
MGMGIFFLDMSRARQAAYDSDGPESTRRFRAKWDSERIAPGPFKFRLGVRRRVPARAAAAQCGTQAAVAAAAWQGRGLTVRHSPGSGWQ